MNKKIIIGVFGFLMFVGVMVFAQNNPNVRWEYNTLNIIGWSASDVNQELNRLGQGGWELVTNAEVALSNTRLLILKRRLQ